MADTETVLLVMTDSESESESNMGDWPVALAEAETILSRFKAARDSHAPTQRSAASRLCLTRVACCLMSWLTVVMFVGCLIALLFAVIDYDLASRHRGQNMTEAFDESVATGGIASLVFLAVAVLGVGPTVLLSRAVGNMEADASARKKAYHKAFATEPAAFVISLMDDPEGLAALDPSYYDDERVVRVASLSTFRQGLRNIRWVFYKITGKIMHSDADALTQSLTRWLNDSKTRSRWHVMEHHTAVAPLTNFQFMVVFALLSFGISRD